MEMFCLIFKHTSEEVRKIWGGHPYVLLYSLNLKELRQHADYYEECHPSLKPVTDIKELKIPEDTKRPPRLLVFGITKEDWSYYPFQEENKKIGE